MVGIFRIYELTKENCNFQGILEDISAYCFSHSCDIYRIAAHFTNNFYKIMSYLSDEIAGIFTPGSN